MVLADTADEPPSAILCPGIKEYWRDFPIYEAAEMRPTPFLYRTFAHTNPLPRLLSPHLPGYPLHLSDYYFSLSPTLDDILLLYLSLFPSGILSSL